nr:MAG TPA: hypothetical protein [Siphoviridae sp. ctEci12]
MAKLKMMPLPGATCFVRSSSRDCVSFFWSS